MKTIRYITAVTMILLMGIPPTQAQSERRKANPEQKERTEAARKPSQVNTSKNTVSQRKPSASQQARQSQVQRSPQAQQNQVQRSPQAQQKQVQRSPQARQSQVQRSPQAQPARQVQERQVEHNRQAQPSQQAIREARTPVSMSTSNNPRSTYRKPNSTIVVNPEKRAATVNAYSSERYYSGKHYHYVYPTRKVNVHYHYDTYLNNYHVLYYPTYTHIYWTRSMYRDYRRWYPNYYWKYNYGYRIQTISVFDAKYSLGEVAMVYGRVYATWYNQETNDYLLFFGGEYPYHQFTVVLPARVARKFSWRPERFFLGEHITVTGLITTFEGVPEIIVKDKMQLGLY